MRILLAEKTCRASLATSSGLAIQPLLLILTILTALMSLMTLVPPMPATAQSSGQDPPHVPGARAETPLLSGRVRDAATGLPLVGANVFVQDTTVGTVSVTGGFFDLHQLPPPPFTLMVTYTGYEAARVTLTSELLAAGEVLELALQPTVYVEDAIVVTASRYGSDVHLTHTNLSRQEIRLRKSDVSLPVLMEDTPGLYAQRDAGNAVGYTYLKIRGFDQRRVGVLINGIPLNDPEDHQVYWVDLPDFESSLQDVQVQRGITNSVGGLGAIGGTVNLVTDLHPDTPSGYFSLEGGSYATGKQTLAYRTGKLGEHFSSLIRLSHLGSDGYREHAASDQWAAFWSGRYVTDKTDTQLNLYTGREVTHQAWLAADEPTLASNRKANPETYHNAVDDFRQPHLELHNDWYLSRGILLRNSFYLIHGEGFYENFVSDAARRYSLDRYFGLAPDTTVSVVQQLWVRKDQVGWLPQLEVTHRGGRLLLGGDVYTFHSNHWGDVVWAEGFTPTDFAGGLKFQDFTGDKVAWSLFANDRLEILSGLTFLVDLQLQRRRYELTQNEVGNFRGSDRHAFTVDYDFFNPKGGLHYKVPGEPGGGTLGFYGYVGRSQLEPSLYDLYDTWLGPEVLGIAPLFENSRPVYAADGQTVDYLVWSDPVVQPERVVNYELGASFRTGRFAVTLNGYWMDSREEIVPFGGYYLGYGIKGNAEKTYHRGFELDLRAQLADRHDLIVVASRSWDRFEEFVYFENVYDADWNLVDTIARDYAGNPIALFPEYLASVIWRGRFSALDASVRFRAVGRQFLDNSGKEARTIAPYNVLDLGGALDFGRLGWREATGARVWLKVRNLLDEKYETNGYYIEGIGNHKIPAAPRNFWVAVEYDF